MNQTNGYIYIRSHESYDTYNVCKFHNEIVSVAEAILELNPKVKKVKKSLVILEV